MMPKITVLMSVYNGLPYLQAAVDSILSQSFTDFEFLIIDDGSNDGSRALLEAVTDPRVSLVKNEKRLGLGANLQKGVEMAKGEWIARMDADDISLPNRLEVQYNYALAHPNVDIIGSWATDINEQGQPIGQRRMPTDHTEIIRYIWTCPIIHPTAFFRKSAIIRAGSYNMEKRRQDYALWFRCAKAGLVFANIPEVLLQYRFANEYFTKNNRRALLSQVQIGWRGCWLVGAGPVAYLGVSIPLIRSLFPRPLQRGLTKLQKRFDPRRRKAV